MSRLLHRVVSGVVIANLKVFTMITKRPRARVLVVDERGRILLIRAHISHGKWTLPGGGLNRGESAVAGARRELREETGIAADESAFMYVATLQRPDYDIPFIAPVFLLYVASGALPAHLYNPREIQAIGWFECSALPVPLSPTVSAALDLAQRTHTLR